MSEYSYTRTHDGKYLVKGPAGYFREEFKTEEEAQAAVKKWEEASARGRQRAENNLRGRNHD